MNKIKITLSSGEPCVTPHSAFKLPSFLWIYLVWVTCFLYTWILLADRLGSSTIHSHWRFLWYKFVVCCSEFFWNVGHVDWTFKAAVCQCGALLLEQLTKMLWLSLLCWGWPSYIKHCVKLQYEYIFFKILLKWILPVTWFRVHVGSWNACSGSVTCLSAVSALTYNLEPKIQCVFICFWTHSKKVMIRSIAQRYDWLIYIWLFLCLSSRCLLYWIQFLVYSNTDYLVMKHL